MPVNRGKQFESVVQECFQRVSNVSVTRLHDQTAGYLGARNPCDFLVYHKPFLYAIECKSIHGNTFPFTNITDFQFKALLEMSQVKGVFAGVIVWFVDKDETIFFNIQLLDRLRKVGKKSVHSYPEWIEYVQGKSDYCYLVGTKKRVFFNYNMVQFLREMEDGCL